jgi:cell division septal protein FtsQ
VSREGEVFAAPGGENLPRLRGPGSAALQVVREYEEALVALAPLDSPIAEFRLSPRGAWHATLASGLAIALGRGDWRPRAERFVAAWPKLSPEARATGFADLRYSSGFAMKRAATLTLSPTRTLSTERGSSR